MICQQSMNVVKSLSYHLLNVLCVPYAYNRALAKGNKNVRKSAYHRVRSGSTDLGSRGLGSVSSHQSAYYVTIPVIDLPDLWDCDAVAEWLQQEIQEALLELLKQDKPLRYDEEGRIKVMQVIVDVINPYA